MAKNMAILIGNEVANIAVFSDLEPESEAAKNCGDYPVHIGDNYAAGRFYRDGELLKSDAEILSEIMEVYADDPS